MNASAGVLKKAGFRLYIITNGVPHTQQQRLTRSGLLPLISGVFVSEAVGAQKPFKPFFDHVLAKIAEHYDSYAFYTRDVWLKSLPTLIVAAVTFIEVFSNARVMSVDRLPEVAIRNFSPV